MRGLKQTASMSLLLGVICLTVPTSAEPAPEGPPQAPALLALKDGRMTARINSVPLRHVLDEFARLTGAELVGFGNDGEKPVSVAFRDVPVADALRRILRQRSFMVTFRSSHAGERVMRVSLLGFTGNIAQLPDSTTHSKMADEDATVRSGPDLELLTDRALEAPDPAARIEAMGLLVQGGGADEVVDVLGRVLASEREPEVKRVALEYLEALGPVSREAAIAALRGEEDPYLRSWALTQLLMSTDMDDQEVATLRWLADNDPDPWVREAAAAVLAL